jgi:hypothetical protein
MGQAMFRGELDCFFELRSSLLVYLIDKGIESEDMTVSSSCDT